MIRSGILYLLLTINIVASEKQAFANFRDLYPVMLTTLKNGPYKGKQKSIDNINRKFSPNIQNSTNSEVFKIMGFAFFYNSQKTNNSLLTDSLSFKIIITLLSHPHKSVCEYIERQLFYRQVSYPLIFKNRDKILNLLGSNRKENTRLYLLLIDSDEYQVLKRDSTILKQNLEIGARLGDSTSINSLLKLFDNTNYFWRDKVKITRQLIYSGNKRAIRGLLSRFHDPMLSFYGIQESIKIPILKELHRLHPNEPVLKELYTHISPYKNEPFNHKRDEEYLKRVLIWIKETYGIVPSNPNNTPLILRKFKGN